MADRKQFLGNAAADPELLELLKAAKSPSEQEMREQRISFAYGNAMNSERITKDSVRKASGSLSLRS